MAAGLRELREETGYEAEQAQLLGRIFPNPAIMSNTCFTVLAQNCRLKHPTELDSGEDLLTRLVPVSDIPALVRSGKIGHSLVVVALYHFELWERDRIEETLISLPTNESIYKSFQQGLAKRRVDWFTGIEVSTVDLVETYVANGYGIGLSVALPRAKHRSQIRLLPLDDFSPVTFGVLWQGKLSPITQAFLTTVQQAAQALTS